MSTLKVASYSVMDCNLEDEWDTEDIEVELWLEFIKEMPHVVNAEWLSDESKKSYTLITFDSEAHKNWFILRWS